MLADDQFEEYIGTLLRGHSTLTRNEDDSLRQHLHDDQDVVVATSSLKKCEEYFAVFCLIGLSFFVGKKAETVKNMQIDIRTPFQKTFLREKEREKICVQRS